MKTYSKILALVLALYFSQGLCEGTENNSKNNKIEEYEFSIKLNEVKSYFEITKMELDAVRRDQLNYKIEKDLLKEAYSSNLNTINMVITISLGAFTILFAFLGFLGFKSINETKKEFSEELENLRAIRSVFESKIPDIDNRLSNAGEKLEEISRINIEQDTRLQLLEIQEKAGSHFSNGNYKRALEYLKVGLASFPDDSILRYIEISCFLKLQRSLEAKDAIEKSLKIEPDNYSNIVNLIEIYFFTENFGKANSLIDDNKDLILSNHGENLIWYFQCINEFFNGSSENLKEIINKAPEENRDKKNQKLQKWTFEEVRTVIEKNKDKDGYKRINSAIEYLQGKISYQDLINAVNA